MATQAHIRMCALTRTPCAHARILAQALASCFALLCLATRRHVPQTTIMNLRESSKVMAAGGHQLAGSGRDKR